MVIPILFTVLVNGHRGNQNKRNHHPKNHGDKNSGTQRNVSQQLKSILNPKGNNYHAKNNDTLGSRCP
jgi:hypothetical protein